MGPYKDQESKLGDISLHTGSPPQPQDHLNTILYASERYNNEWVNTVKPRILFVSDMPAVNVVYWKQCSVNFYLGYNCNLPCTSSVKGIHIFGNTLMFTDPKNIYLDTTLVNICISITFPQKMSAILDLTL